MGGGVGQLQLRARMLMMRAAFGGALALHKNLCIGEAGVKGHQAGCQKCVQHGLHEGAVGWLMRRCAGICKEEAPRGCAGPNVGGNRDGACGADTLGNQGMRRGKLGLDCRWRGV